MEREKEKSNLIELIIQLKELYLENAPKEDKDKKLKQIYEVLEAEPFNLNNKKHHELLSECIGQYLDDDSDIRKLVESLCSKESVKKDNAFYIAVNYQVEIIINNLCTEFETYKNKKDEKQEEAITNIKKYLKNLSEIQKFDKFDADSFFDTYKKVHSGIEFICCIYDSCYDFEEGVVTEAIVNVITKKQTEALNTLKSNFLTDNDSVQIDISNISKNLLFRNLNYKYRQIFEYILTGEEQKILSDKKLKNLVELSKPFENQEERIRFLVKSNFFLLDSDIFLNKSVEEVIDLISKEISKVGNSSLRKSSLSFGKIPYAIGDLDHLNFVSQVPQSIIMEQSGIDSNNTFKESEYDESYFACLDGFNQELYKNFYGQEKNKKEIEGFLNEGNNRGTFNSELEKVYGKEIYKNLSNNIKKEGNCTRIFDSYLESAARFKRLTNSIGDDEKIKELRETKEIKGIKKLLSEKQLYDDSVRIDNATFDSKEKVLNGILVYMEGEEEKTVQISFKLNGTLGNFYVNHTSYDYNILLNLLAEHNGDLAECELKIGDVHKSITNLDELFKAQPSVAKVLSGCDSSEEFNQKLEHFSLKPIPYKLVRKGAVTCEDKSASVFESEIDSASGSDDCDGDGEMEEEEEKKGEDKKEKVEKKVDVMRSLVDVGTDGSPRSSCFKSSEKSGSNKTVKTTKDNETVFLDDEGHSFTRESSSNIKR